jgi:hypothetical protein
MNTHPPTTDNDRFLERQDRQPQKSVQADNRPRPDIPHWIRNDGRWERLPPGIRETALQILVPAYRQFVLEAPNELERTVGLTLVHLTWLEICEQIKLADTSQPGSFESIIGNPREMFNRHLRLTMAKCQTAGMLQRLQVAQTSLRKSLAAPLPARPSSFPSIENPDETGDPYPAISQFLRSCDAARNRNQEKS